MPFNAVYNDIVVVPVPDKLLNGYQLPTGEDINSVTIITQGDIFATIGGLNYDGNFVVRQNSKWTFSGKEMQRLFAPITINVIVVTPGANNAVFILLKRYNNAELQN